MTGSSDQHGKSLHQARLTRRRLLGGGVVVLGAGVAAAAVDVVLDLSPPLPGKPLVSSPGGASSSSSGSHNFVSRPDLRPPRIQLGVDEPAKQDPGLVVTECHAGSGQQGPMIIGQDGSLVWFRPLSDHGTAARRAFNVRVQQYQGKRVLTYFDGAVTDGHGEGVYRLLDDRYRLVATVSAANGLHGDLHEFVLTPQGTALFSTYGTATGDLSSVGGASAGRYYYGEVQEVDVATGRLLFSWRSDQHIGFDESYSTLPPPTRPWDYFHLNSINVDPADGNLVVSSRCCWAFYKVDRHSGEVLWRLGGKKSDFRLPSDARFEWQHDVTPLADGTVTLFDNVEPTSSGSRSRGLVLRVDEQAHTATLVSQYQHQPGLSSPVLGSVQTLAQGHRFVGWGTTTYFTEYDADGRPVLDGHLDGSGLESYRAYKDQWSATPVERPALVVKHDNGSTVAYVSWNGATDVASWRVQAGPSADRLAAAGTAPRSGFETKITVPHLHSHVQVEALDAEGRALGRSPVVPAT